MSFRKLLVGLLVLTSMAAFAQSPWPSKPIRMVVPLSAGGGTDQITRQISAKLSERLGQPVVIDNRPGAGGNLGSDHVAKSAPDGYTLLMGTSATHATNVALYGDKMPYNTVTDFTPLTLVGSVPLILMANNAFEGQSVKDLIGIARAKPGVISYGSSGNGTASQLVMEQIKRQTGTDIAHVPYKGAAQATQDLLGGHVALQFDSAAAALALVRAGKVKALGITSLKRTAYAPEIPALSETLPGFEYNAWVGFFAPAGLPSAIAQRLRSELEQILTLPDIRASLTTGGFEITPLSGEAFSNLVKADIVKFGKIVAASGAKLD